MLSELANETKDYILLRFCEFFSFKAEKQSTYSNFIYKLNSLFRVKEDSFFNSLLYDYFNFQFDILHHEMTVDSIKRVLSFSSMLPFIYMYENVIKICSFIVSNERHKNLVPEVISLLSNLNVNDFRISNLKLLSGQCLVENFNFQEVTEQNVEHIVELYTKGNYEECITLINKLDDSSLYFNLYEILAKCIIHKNIDIITFETPYPIIKENILLPVYNILICNQKGKFLNNLLDFAKRTGNLSISHEIISFYSRHINLDNKTRDSYKIISDINSYQITPRFMFSIEKQDVFLNKIVEAGFYPNTVSLFRAYLKNSFNDSLLKEIPEERSILYKIKSLSNVSPNQAIIEFEKLVEKLKGNQEGSIDLIDYFYYERVLNELYSLYLAQGKVEHAINLYVDSYFINSDMVMRINYRDVIDYIDSNKIKVSTIKNIIFNHINGKNDSLVFKSLITFLTENQMSLPSELIPWVEENSMFKNEIIFILSKVCSKEVMKRFVRLTPKTRNEERIKILKYLADADKGQALKYLDEIKEISKLQSVQERVESVVEKKIYVDINAIMLEQEKILREKFERYQRARTAL